MTCNAESAAAGNHVPRHVVDVIRIQLNNSVNHTTLRCFRRHTASVERNNFSVNKRNAVAHVEPLRIHHVMPCPSKLFPTKSQIIFNCFVKQRLPLLQPGGKCHIVERSHTAVDIFNLSPKRIFFLPVVRACLQSSCLGGEAA